MAFTNVNVFYSLPTFRIQVTAGATLTKGIGFLQGQHFLLPLNDAVSGDLVECVDEADIEINKTSALAITAGDALYWDDTNKVVNKTSAGQKEVGFALADAANPSATVRARIFPTVRTSVAA